MYSKTVSTIALLAALGLAQPALAQSDTEKKPETGAATEQTAPAPESTAKTDQPAASSEGEASTEMKTTEGETSTEMKAEGEVNSTAEAPEAEPKSDEPTSTVEVPVPQPGSPEEATSTAEVPQPKGDDTVTADGTIVVQDADTVLASDFMGTTVYSTSDESLGEINDLILAKDGTLEGVVIGVGGFLGIGEKNVAFSMDRLEMQELDDGLKLVINTTEEELDAAPEFKTTDAQKLEIEAERAKVEQESGGAVNTTPNPANPPANTQ